MASFAQRDNERPRIDLVGVAEIENLEPPGAAVSDRPSAARRRRDERPRERRMIDREISASGCDDELGLGWSRPVGPGTLELLGATRERVFRCPWPVVLSQRA